MLANQIQSDTIRSKQLSEAARTTRKQWPSNEKNRRSSKKRQEARCIISIVDTRRLNKAPFSVSFIVFEVTGLTNYNPQSWCKWLLKTRPLLRLCLATRFALIVEWKIPSGQVLALAMCFAWNAAVCIGKYFTSLSRPYPKRGRM